VEAGHTGAGHATTAPVIALTRRQGGGVSGVLLDEVRPAEVSQFALGVVALEYIPGPCTVPITVDGHCRRDHHIHCTPL